MAKIPVRVRGGGIEALIDVLEAGQADPDDQKFAAQLLRLAGPSRHSESNVHAVRKWHIYWQVRSYLDGGTSLNAACKLVAAEHAKASKDAPRIESAYAYEHEGGRPRTLSWTRIKALYEEARDLSADLDRWIEENEGFNPAD